MPESRLYTELQAFEKKLDATISRKRFDIQEALSVPMKVGIIKICHMLWFNLCLFCCLLGLYRINENHFDLEQTRRTLRVFISNLAANQDNVDNVMGYDPSNPPSWTLKIEGRLLDVRLSYLFGGSRFASSLTRYLKTFYVQSLQIHHLKASNLHANFRPL